MKKLLEKALKVADSAEVTMVKTTEIPAHFENYQLQQIQTKKTLGVVLRILKDKKPGRAYGTSLENSDILVQQALKSSDFTQKEEYDFAEKSSPGKRPDIYSQKIAGTTLSEMVSEGRSILDKIKKQAPQISADLHIGKAISDLAIINSRGADYSAKKTLYQIYLTAKTTKGAGYISKEKTSCNYFAFPEEKIQELIKEHEYTNTLCNVATEKKTVIFTAETLWTFLYRFYLGIHGDNVLRGISPLKDKINTSVFDKNITIIDDPTINWGVSSCAFDDEGTPTEKKTLVENGILKNFIYDLRTAARAKTKSTGNGFRAGMWDAGIHLAPQPHPANLVIKPGEKHLTEIISQLPEAILVKSLLGFHSGNLTQGEFSMNVGMGFLIKDGKIKGRVIDTMVSGNIYESFNNILAISNKQETSPMGILPDILFDKMSVTGAG